MDELAERVLAHLHANSALGPDQLATMLGAQRMDVDAALAELVRAGHLEREGERFEPTGDSLATPGLFVTTEREDAESVDVDLPEGDVS
jgi:hypothetical protein